MSQTTKKAPTIISKGKGYSAKKKKKKNKKVKVKGKGIYADHVVRTTTALWCEAFARA